MPALWEAIHKDLGILGNSGISGELSAIPADFVLAKIIRIAGFR